MSQLLYKFSTTEAFILFNYIFVKAYENKVEILVTMIRIMDKEKVKYTHGSKKPELFTPT